MKNKVKPKIVPLSTKDKHENNSLKKGKVFF